MTAEGSTKADNGSMTLGDLTSGLDEFLRSSPSGEASPARAEGLAAALREAVSDSEALARYRDTRERMSTREQPNSIAVLGDFPYVLRST